MWSDRPDETECSGRSPCVRAEFLRAGTIQELKSKGRLVVRGAHRPILVVEGGCCTDVPNFPWRAEGDRRQAISAWNFIVRLSNIHSKGRRRVPGEDLGRPIGGAVARTFAIGEAAIWFTEEALAGWRARSRKTPGGQPHYSNLAIETALTLRAVFRLALRQSEGLIGSIMRLLEIDLPHFRISFDAKSSGWWAAGSEPTTFWSSP